MSIFKEVGLTWDGKEYVVPSEKVMGLVGVIEEHITLEEMVGTGVKRVKVAKAFSAALVYAGCRVSEEAVYEKLFFDRGLTTTNTVAAILSIVVPPDSVKNLMPKKPVTQSKPKAKGGLKKPT
jgi:hypothetical protein